MAIDFTSTTFMLIAAQLAGAVLFVLGGLRFRHWVVDGRPGIPKYPIHVETVLLWLIYSSVVAGAVIVVKQTFRHI